MKRIIALIVIVAFAGTFASCTTCRELSVRSAADVGGVRFDPEKNYEVRFAKGPSYRLKGDRLQASGDLICIMFEDAVGRSCYKADQIERICVREHSRGKTTLAAVLGGIEGASQVWIPYN